MMRVRCCLVYIITIWVYIILLCFSMDLAGIEPASESSSIKTSSITVISLTFPPCSGKWQSPHFSSFIDLLLPQSFGGRVPYLFDAGDPNSRLFGADSSVNYAANANLGSAFIFKFSRFLCGSGPQMAILTSKPPSKPLQAQLWCFATRNPEAPKHL